MSKDVSQVGVALFTSFNIFYHFTFSGFPFILIFTYSKTHKPFNYRVDASLNYPGTIIHVKKKA